MAKGSRRRLAPQTARRDESPEKKRTTVEKVKTPNVTSVTFKYIFDNQYNPVYANGAYGGLTTLGEIALHFYVERNPIPLEETFSVAPDGRVREAAERQPLGQDGTLTVIRYVTTGVIMNREVAKRVYEFLGRQLTNLEAAEKPSTPT